MTQPSKQSLEIAGRILFPIKARSTKSLDVEIALALDQAKEEQREADARIAENYWGQRKFFDESDQEKWSQLYTEFIESEVTGWNRAKDKIAQAIRDAK